MVRKIGTMLVLIALWLLMSGLFTPFLVLLGVLSALLTTWITIRMDKADGEHLNFTLKPFHTLKYIAWLMVEIVKANWRVTMTILSPSMSIRQNLFEVKISQETDIARVMFANSITLTPGTITVETEHDHFIVHALDYSDPDLDALADMDSRVTRIETGRVSS